MESFYEKTLLVNMSKTYDGRKCLFEILKKVNQLSLIYLSKKLLKLMSSTKN